MPKFTVYLITHEYERWDTVEFHSEEELMERLEEEGTDFLGDPDKVDTTSAFFDVSPEDPGAFGEEPEPDDKEDDPYNGGGYLTESPWERGEPL